jgi:hypothetical protein
MERQWTLKRERASGRLVRQASIGSSARCTLGNQYIERGGTKGARISIWFTMRAVLGKSARRVPGNYTAPFATHCGLRVSRAASDRPRWCLLLAGLQVVV